MMEAAAMVLVQSSRELGRVCVQVSSGLSFCVQEFLKEFLSKWQFENGKYVAAADSVMYAGGAHLNLVLEVEEYLKVVEFYAVTLLVMVLNNPDHAILLIEKAFLPEEARQDLLRRARSLFSLQTTRSQVEEKEISSFPVKEVDESEKSLKVWSAPYPDGAGSIKQPISRWPGRLEQCFCWFRNIIFRYGNTSTAASNARILLGCLIFILFYRLRKKRHAIIS